MDTELILVIKSKLSLIRTAPVRLIYFVRVVGAYSSFYTVYCVVFCSVEQSKYVEHKPVFEIDPYKWIQFSWGL